jgi:hypothetical protein
VRYNINAVVDEIIQVIEKRIEENSKTKFTPHPSPLPKGRGEMEKSQ